MQNTLPVPESSSTAAVAVYSNHQSTPAVSGSLLPNQEEIQSTTSKTDGTAEAQNTAGQMQDLQSERNISSKSFDASVSSSHGNQSEPEHGENGKGKGKKSCLQPKQLSFYHWGCIFILLQFCCWEVNFCRK